WIKPPLEAMDLGSATGGRGDRLNERRFDASIATPARSKKALDPHCGVRLTGPAPPCRAFFLQTTGGVSEDAAYAADAPLPGSFARRHPIERLTIARY